MLCLTYTLLQPAMHFIRQAAAVSTRNKKNSNTPVRIAPRMLVAAKVIAKRIMARIIVPKIAISNAFRAVHIHLLSAA